MNRLLTDVLGWRASQTMCAHALVAFPRAVQLLALAKPPGHEAFVGFVTAMQSAAPDAPTQCDGWTVHELTAHVAAGSAEIADLIELELAGQPSRATRDFDEREAPYRALSPKLLRRRFFEEAFRATVAVERLFRAGRDRQVFFTGTALDARTLMLHIESELVIHRWDIVGNDAAGVAALSDPRLALHAATTVAAMQPNVFPRRTGDHTTIVLRSAGSDIAVTGGTVTSVEPAPPGHSLPVVECHPAARTLLLWGRDPRPHFGIPTGDPEAVDAVSAMLLPAQHTYR